MAYVPYTNVKFGMKSGIGSATNDCDWCIMRVEEMMLIEAEGLAMSNQEGEAKSKLEAFVKNYRDQAILVQPQPKKLYKMKYGNSAVLSYGEKVLLWQTSCV